MNDLDRGRASAERSLEDTVRVDVHALPLSQVQRCGDLLFVSGQLPLLPDGSVSRGGIEEQTALVISNLSSALASAGAELRQVVKTTVWLSAASLAGGFNAAYAGAFAPNFPARSTVISSLLVPADIEMEAIAYLGED